MKIAELGAEIEETLVSWREKNPSPHSLSEHREDIRILSQSILALEAVRRMEGVEEALAYDARFNAETASVARSDKRCSLCDDPFVPDDSMMWHKGLLTHRRCHEMAMTDETDPSAPVVPVRGVIKDIRKCECREWRFEPWHPMSFCSVCNGVRPDESCDSPPDAEPTPPAAGSTGE